MLITPTQCRMARAACQINLRDTAKAIGVSHTTVRRYETGVSVGANIVKDLAEFFHKRGIFFGPCDAVCVGRDTFAEDRWLARALYTLLEQHGIRPTSKDLLQGGAQSFP